MVANETRDSSDPVVEVEFTIDGGSYPFIRGSEVLTCTFELTKLIPRRESYAEFFAVEGAAPDRIAALADDREGIDSTVIDDHESGGLFEFEVAENCPAYDLAERGALPQRVEARDGEGRLLADIPADCDAAAVTGGFLEDHPRAALATKRETDSVQPPFSADEVQHVMRRRLTERQCEVLRAAFEAGYYEWPRECDGAAVAAELGISTPTFSEHVRVAERKLLGVLFDGGRE